MVSIDTVMSTVRFKYLRKVRSFSYLGHKIWAFLCSARSVYGTFHADRHGVNEGKIQENNDRCFPARRGQDDVCLWDAAAVERLNEENNQK